LAVFDSSLERVQIEPSPIRHCKPPRIILAPGQVQERSIGFGLIFNGPKK
jgi:hypothetical protein